MITRRNLLRAALASAALSMIASRVQGQTRPRRIGFLWEGEQSRYDRYIDPFKRGMRELGYVEGRDYVIEHRSANDDLARLPALAAELVARKIDLIVAGATPVAMAARKATRDIPILIVTVGDPVGNDLAANLRHPGGNVTGLTSVNTELDAKRLDLLRQILPGMRRVGFLYNPDSAGSALVLSRFESACDKLQFKVIPAPTRKAQEIAAVFNTLMRDKAQGLVVSTGDWNFIWREILIEHAAKHRLPAIYGNSVSAESGGLISYSPNRTDLFRRAAAYADKIFKGAKPGDLPIEQANKFELIINRKTAKALGVTIPQSVLVSADKVIE